MQLIRRLSPILFTAVALFGPGVVYSEPVSCMVVLDNHSQAEQKKSFLTPFVQYLRSNYLNKATTPLQTQIIEELLRRNIIYKPSYKAALELKTEEQRDLFLHFLNSENSASLPEHYWEVLSQVHNPYQKDRKSVV